MGKQTKELTDPAEPIAKDIGQRRPNLEPIRHLESNSEIRRRIGVRSSSIERRRPFGEPLRNEQTSILDYGSHMLSTYSRRMCELTPPPRTIEEEVPGRLPRNVCGGVVAQIMTLQKRLDGLNVELPPKLVDKLDSLNLSTPKQSMFVKKRRTQPAQYA